MNAQDSEFEISLVRDDLLFRLQRRLGLIPDHGLGLIRRAIFFSLVAWLPVVAWAVFNGRALPGTVSEPLLQHFGIHVRFLLALPLLIVGEGSVHGMTTRLIPYFHTSGLIRNEQREAFREVLRDMFQLRNSSYPWIVIAALIIAWIGFQPPSQDKHELVWANIGEPTRFNLGFGGWWLDHVAQPIFFALLCAWLWRLILLFLLMKRIAALDLQFVPTHSDRAGGLGFLERLTKAFSLFTFALSAVLASRLAHDVIYHGVHVMSLKLEVVVFLILLVMLCLTPLMVFIPKLAAAKKQALLDYGALVGEHGRLVHRRWILGESLDDSSLLEAQEIGPVADTVGLYEAVANMRVAPIGKSAVLFVALPALIPMLMLFAIEIPIKEMLLKILGSLA
jgi:hypothetical protein